MPHPQLIQRRWTELPPPPSLSQSPKVGALPPQRQRGRLQWERQQRLGLLAHVASCFWCGDQWGVQASDQGAAAEAAEQAGKAFFIREVDRKSRSGGF